MRAIYDKYPELFWYYVVDRDSIGFQNLIQYNGEGKGVAIFKVTAWRGCPL